MRISDWSSDVCSSDLPRVEQDDAGINAFGAAAFERQFGGDLPPALALGADQRVGGQVDALEKDFGEMRVAGEVIDRPDGHARRSDERRAGTALCPYV